MQFTPTTCTSCPIVHTVNGGPTWLDIPAAQSWAEAVGAAGTVLAFAVAAFVYARAERNRIDAEGDQARLVYAVDVGDEVHHAVFMKNASSELVHNVNGLVHVFILGDGIDIHDTYPIDHIYTLEPGEPRQVWGHEGDLADVEGANPDDMPIVDRSVEIYFDDARGRKWTRGLSGEPRRLRPKHLRWQTQEDLIWLNMRLELLRREIRKGHLRQQSRADMNWLRSRGDALRRFRGSR